MSFAQVSREMSRDEIDEFLRSQGQGLLSLASHNRAYCIPIVYGYDPDAALFTMELLFQQQSKKRAFLAETEEASLCVYDWNRQNEWQSVIASGPLERVEDSERITEMMALLSGNTDDIVPWSLRSPLSELEGRSWYALDSQSLTGYCAD